jgi:hypothetical protein
MNCSYSTSQIPDFRSEVGDLAVILKKSIFQQAQGKAYDLRFI